MKTTFFDLNKSPSLLCEFCLSVFKLVFRFNFFDRSEFISLFSFLNFGDLYEVVEQLWEIPVDYDKLENMTKITREQ